MADYTKFVKLATRLITAKGRSITLQRLSDSVADPDKPWLGNGEPTITAEVTAPAVFVPHMGSDLGMVVANPELLSTVDQVALVAPVQEGLELMNQILDTDGQVWRIEWVQVLKPAEQTVLYVVGVKR